MFTEKMYEELVALRKVEVPTEDQGKTLASLEDEFQTALVAAERANAYATKADRKLDVSATAFIGAIPIMTLPTSDVLAKVTGKTDDGRGYWCISDNKAFIVSGVAIDRAAVTVGGRIIIACSRLLKGKKYSWTNAAGVIVAETMNADALRGRGFPQAYTIEDLKFDIELARKGALERSSTAQNLNA